MTRWQENICLCFCLPDDFFCLGAKVLNLILPSRLGRRGASESAPQAPHVTDRAWKITFCLLCQNPKQLITWSLLCNFLSSYISVWSDTDTSVIFSFSVPFSLSLHRPDTSLRAQFKFTDEILKTKSLARETHDFRYPAWTIWREPCLHKMLISLPPSRLGDSVGLFLQNSAALIKPSASLLLDYCCHFAMQEPMLKGCCQPSGPPEQIHWQKSGRNSALWKMSESFKKKKKKNPEKLVLLNIKC